MKPRVSEQLKELLNNTSQEQFDRDWAAIEALGFEGPSAESFIELSLMSAPIADLNIITEIVSKLSETFTETTVGDYNYALAA